MGIGARLGDILSGMGRWDWGKGVDICKEREDGNF